MKQLLLAAVLLVGLSAHAQTIWEENFDGGNTLPTGWSQVTLATDGGWKIGQGAGLSSQSYVIPGNGTNVVATNDDGCGNACNKLEEYLITPVIDLSGTTNLFMTMDMVYYDQIYQSKKEHLTLNASTDGGATWTEIKEFTSTTSDWQTSVGVDISAFAGQASIQFAWKYSDGGGWLYGAALDNIKIVVPDQILKATLKTAAIGAAIDVIPTVAYGYPKYWTGGEMVMNGTISNPGFVPITSFDIEVTDGTQTWTQSYTGVDIQLAGEYDFTFDNTYIVKAGANALTVTVKNINGGVDNDPLDNTADLSVEGVTANPKKKVVAEEGTGTWCGWCPRGTVMVDYMTERYPDNFIGIAVHNGDPMTVAAYDNAMGNLIGGYPSGLVDRVHNDVDPTDFEQYYIDRVSETVPVEMNQSVTFTESTRLLTITNTLTFTEDMNGDYRLAFVILEDNVDGTAANYLQTNYYSGGGVGPMAGWEDEADKVDVDYDHVAKALVGPFGGNTGTVPATNLAGSTHMYTKTYTVPSTINVDNSHVVTMIIKTSDGSIVNAAENSGPYPLATSANDIQNEVLSASIAPNPVQDFAKISVNVPGTEDVRIRVTDASGRIVADRLFNNVTGDQVIPFATSNLAAGAYTMSIQTSKASVMQKFAVVR